MSRIKVNPDRVSGLQRSLQNVSTASNDAVSNLDRVRSNLDWQITSRSNIDARLASLQRRLRTQVDLMNSYAGFLITVNNSFTATDGNLRNQARDVMYRMNQITIDLRTMNGAQSRVDYEKGSRLSAASNLGTLFGSTIVGFTPLGYLQKGFKLFGEENLGWGVVNLATNVGIGAVTMNVVLPKAAKWGLAVIGAKPLAVGAAVAVGVIGTAMVMNHVTSWAIGGLRNWRENRRNRR